MDSLEMLIHYLRHQNIKFLFKKKRGLLKLRVSCRVAITPDCVHKNIHTDIQTNEVNAAARV